MRDDRRGRDASTGPVPRGSDELLAVFGRVDIYLFDQMLRGRLAPDMRILDAGCGDGRNAHYLMRCGAQVFGIDQNAGAVAVIRERAKEAAPTLPTENFQQGRLDAIPFSDGTFDAVICSAVLHFAESEEDFDAMVAEMWRVLRPGGVFFARLASTIGIESRVRHDHGRRYALPDGSDRFLVDEEYLVGITERMGGEFLDPIKTTNVQNVRAMTTWVLRKGAAA